MVPACLMACSTMRPVHIAHKRVLKVCRRTLRTILGRGSSAAGTRAARQLMQQHVTMQQAPASARAQPAQLLRLARRTIESLRNAVFTAAGLELRAIMASVPGFTSPPGQQTQARPSPFLYQDCHMSPLIELRLGPHFVPGLPHVVAHSLAGRLLPTALPNRRDARERALESVSLST